jgi:RHS repeat-associated protein
LISRQKDTFCSTTISAAASDSSGRTTDSFKYDPFGRRIEKSSSAAASVFAYDDDNLIEETNSSGTVVARYAETENIDEPLAMLRSSATSYYEQDGVGSVTSLSNAAGALAQTYAFDSFGNLTASTGSVTNPFRYTARDFDTETNLQFSRARYYDPVSGRFLSEDPLAFDASLNFYSYVSNSPTSFNDPFGLAECVYSISQHTLVCTSNFVPPVGPTWSVQVGPGGVHSGDPGGCRDNPKCANNWGSGPIQPGRFKMNFDNRPEHQGWGDYRLEPSPYHWWHGPLERLHMARGGFELHIGSITHGCINADKTDPQAVGAFHAMQ